MGALKMSTATLASISLGLLLAALASDYWVRAKDHTGLWQVCRDSFCQPYGMDVLAYIHATRAFMLMAAFAGAISFFGFWHLVCSSSAGSVTSSKISAVASLLAGLSALIAMSVFTGVYNTYYSVGHYGWSLGVGWASVPLFLITGGLGFQVVAETAM